MQKYALDFNTLALIEIAVFAVFEYKRYQNMKTTGTVRPAAPQTAEWQHCCFVCMAAPVI